MQALIDFVIRNLLALWPIARVYSWQQGLLVRGGHVRRELSPGLHWRWLFLDEVKKWPSNEVALDLGAASITTTDGVPVALSANVAYRMISIEKMWLSLWNTEETLKCIILGMIATYCASQPWEALRAERTALEAKLLKDLNQRTDAFGIRIERVHLTDLVVTKAHRHYMDGMK